MRSMTGYGRGKAFFCGQQITIEVSSVNRRQSEISLSLPRGLGELEPRLRDEINAQFSRGRLTAVIALHGKEATSPAAPRSQIDGPTARHYYEQLVQLKKDLALQDEITLEVLLKMPGVFTEISREKDPEAYYPPIHEALEQAMTQLLEMRKKEGSALLRDLESRLQKLQDATHMVEARAPYVVESYRTSLLQRVEKIGVSMSLSDEQLLKECVLFADRSDISEELTRLQSHFQQFGSLMRQDKPVGRTLDFILQEMNREVNTMGNKANDMEISQTVVFLKTELEKIREQVQNIE